MARRIASVVLLAGCAHAPPPPPPAPPPAPSVVDESKLPPLVRVCQPALPLPVRSIGALQRLLQRINPGMTVVERDCRGGDSWPIAFATGETPGSGKAPIGFELLRMTGDALLTLDPKNPEAPTVNLCRVLEFALSGSLRVRAVALWDGSDEAAYDPARRANSTATLAWVEVLSRQPSACALGRREEQVGDGDAALQQAFACAAAPLVTRTVAPCALPPATPIEAGPDASAVERAVEASHRYTGPGRGEVAAEGGRAGLERPERCAYEPPPASHDVCLAEYRGDGGGRWYGRGDVTRTGEAGAKNYVDSYLTFMLLKRIEKERKGQPVPSFAEPPPAKN